MSATYFSPPNRLLELLGTYPPARIPDKMETRAADAVTEVGETFSAELQAQIELIYVLADASHGDMPQNLDEIYARAHELRGLCGSFGHEVVGRVANALCTYVEEARTIGRMPRVNILWLHAAALKRAASDEHAAQAIGTYLIDSLIVLREKELDQARPDRNDGDLHDRIVAENGPDWQET